ncbi:MAG: 3-keto-5-aminohexanoate cleavage protein [Simplicispira sp.]|nr:3-keto-5-aminohexanoate cleavage protein [Simplicispira sp.]
MIHLHVRSDAGTHSLDVEKYRAAIASVRELTNDRLLIQVTTEAVGIYEPHEQISSSGRSCGQMPLPVAPAS